MPRSTPYPHLNDAEFYTGGVTPTDYRYTGQLQLPVTGLYFYNTCFYDPLLGRFIQPDTIVPGAGGSAA
jgi:RHS repeat-associated protein